MIQVTEASKYENAVIVFSPEQNRSIRPKIQSSKQARYDVIPLLASSIVRPFVSSGHSYAGRTRHHVIVRR